MSDGGRTERGSGVPNPVETLARLGYVAEGIVYVLVGALTATAAFSAGSSGARDSKSFLASIATPCWATSCS